MLIGDVVMLVCGFVNSKLFSCSFRGSGGQCSVGCVRNSGPFCHNLLYLSWVAVAPRDAISAGFCFVGTYFHNSRGAILFIFINRFSTNCLNSFFGFWIQHKTTVGSDQYVTESIFLTSSRAFFTLSVNWDTKRLDNNFSRGIVCFDKGANLVYEAIRLQ